MRNPPGGPEPNPGYWPFPKWLAQATDPELRAAQKTFWTACATQFKGSATILDFVRAVSVQLLCSQLLLRLPSACELISASPVGRSLRI